MGKMFFPDVSELWGCRDLEDNQIVGTGSGLRITEWMRFLSASLEIFYGPFFCEGQKNLFSAKGLFFQKKGLEIEIES